MISTGINYIDDLTGGLKLGDNVVWQISNGVPVEYFVKSIFGKPDDTGGTIVYINFNYSPHTICKRFDDIFKNNNITMIDAFTFGKGNGDQVFLDFYHDNSNYDLSKIICVKNPRDINAFMAMMNDIQLKNKNGSCYVFDSLTGMNELWKEERSVLDFFSFTCPKLYDLNTIAYWILENEAHSREFIAGLTHITQIVISINNTDTGYYEFKIKKLEDRPYMASGIHHFQIIGREIHFQEEKQANFRIGARVKDLRKSLNITQTEIAARLGMTPGAISQIENDIIAPSLNTLVNLSAILKKPIEYFLGAHTVNDVNPGFTIIRKQEHVRPTHDNLKITPLTGDEMTDIKIYHIRISGNKIINKPILMHKGKEFISIISGVINVKVDGEEHLLRKGDSIYLERSFIERWSNNGKNDCEFIYILL